MAGLARSESMSSRTSQRSRSGIDLTRAESDSAQGSPRSHSGSVDAASSKSRSKSGLSSLVMLKSKLRQRLHKARTNISEREASEDSGERPAPRRSKSRSSAGVLDPGALAPPMGRRSRSTSPLPEDPVEIANRNRTKARAVRVLVKPSVLDEDPVLLANRRRRQTIEDRVIGASIGIFVLLVLAVLVLMALPGDAEEPRRVLVTPLPDEVTATYVRRHAFFPCGREQCHGWVYHPHAEQYAGRRPAVIMAPEIGALKEFALPEVAHHFVAQGFVVLSFDYRGFGSSDGEDRHVIQLDDQLADWESALAFVTTALPEVDPHRIALFGTSLSGGHALTTAAKSKFRSKIKAVVAQVPLVDGYTSVMTWLHRRPWKQAVMLVLRALQDLVREAFEMKRLYVRIFGPTLPKKPPALLPGSEYAKTIGRASDAGWKNSVDGSALFDLLDYRPADHADHLLLPVFIVKATNDTVCPASDVDELIAALPNVDTFIFKGGHFDVYTKPTIDRVLEEETKFLVEWLRP